MMRSQRPPRAGEPDLAMGVRLLDRYSILDRIGSGGMATIYRATDDRLDRVVCVKLLRTTLVEGSGSTSGSRAVYQATYKYFLKEALALSKLSHPNTLRIYDFGYLDDPTAEGGQGAPFHVSEYLDGGHLESHVRTRGALSPREAMGILDGICDAVAEAHEHGIIHRDIKPSNILFARVLGDLVPKLADFGIAHSNVRKTAAPSDPSLSEAVSAVALFSPRWAAPEQLCGSPEGPRTDVYALGLLTVFMLTRTLLFGDEDIRSTFNDRVLGDALVNTRLSQLGLPHEVVNVLGQALLSRPDERIPTAPELVRRLREALKVRGSESVAPLRAAPQNQGEPCEPPPSMREGPPSFSQPQPAFPPRPERRVRYVQVHEKLDLSFHDDAGNPVRFRVSMLPGESVSLNVKGLSCFVAKRGGRSSPAVTVTGDVVIDLVSTGRQELGELSVSFGQPTANGRLFLVDGRQLLIPYAEAQQAVVLVPSRGEEIVVMCRR